MKHNKLIQFDYIKIPNNLDDVYLINLNVECCSIIIFPIYPLEGGYENPKNFEKFVNIYFSPTPYNNEWKCFNNLPKNI